MQLKDINADFQINWCSINLKDELRSANARLLKARAREIELKNESKEN